MLLSPTRSLLLLPPSPENRQGTAEGAGTVANLALLASAAKRLQVPIVCGDDEIEETAAPARDQLVVARPLPSQGPIADSGVEKMFLVIDALAEADRPAIDDLDGLGITAVTTEMVVFEWLERADSDDFRALLTEIR